MSEPRTKIESMEDVLKLIKGEPPDPRVHQEEKRARREKLKAEMRWHEYLCDHPKDQYPAILEEINGLMKPADWCEEVRFAWYNSDVLMNNREAWVRIFSDRVAIVGITTPEEAADFALQSDPLTVYRGCREENRDGMSWSLSFSAAEHFKREVRLGGVIFSGIVRKQDVIAYICPNGEEFEVIVLPEYVTDKRNLG